MLKIADGVADWRRLAWLCLPVVPLGLLIFEVVRWSSHSLNYPQHFNDKCARFDWFYYPNASIENLFIENAIWLSPAVTLILLWDKRRVIVLYTTVCLIFSPIISSMVTDDLASNVNCYRRIGTGDAIIGLFLILQTFILLVYSLPVLIWTIFQLFKVATGREEPSPHSAS